MALKKIHLIYFKLETKMDDKIKEERIEELFEKYRVHMNRDQIGIIWDMSLNNELRPVIRDAVNAYFEEMKEGKTTCNMTVYTYQKRLGLI